MGAPALPYFASAAFRCCKSSYLSDSLAWRSFKPPSNVVACLGQFGLGVEQRSLGVEHVDVDTHANFRYLGSSRVHGGARRLHQKAAAALPFLFGKLINAGQHQTRHGEPARPPPPTRRQRSRGWPDVAPWSVPSELANHPQSSLPRASQQLRGLSPAPRPACHPLKNSPAGRALSRHSVGLSAVFRTSLAYAYLHAYN